MTTLTQHIHGTFCWPELVTIDLDNAKAFYGELFGWEPRDTPLEAGQVYTTFLKRDLEVAAATRLRPALKKHGVAPHWTVYVAVGSVDQCVSRVRGLGGHVVTEPSDVFDLGRMAVIRDPTGAPLSLWEARRHVGAKLVTEPGTLTWCELSTANPEVAGQFYCELFGWQMGKTYKAGFRHTALHLGEEPVAGMVKIETGGVPPAWMPFFEVRSVNAAHFIATEADDVRLRAQILAKDFDIPDVGRFAVLSDPQGAQFGLMRRG